MVSKKTKEEQKAFDRRVFNLITGYSGETIASISRRIGCDWHTVQRSVKRLESQGRIRCIENTGNLKIYENSERNINQYETLAKDKSDANSDDNSPPITMSDSSDKKTPMGKTTRAHITGCYSVGICRAGKMDKAIRDEQGFTIGSWNLEPYRLKASIYYKGSISLGVGEQIKFQAHQSKNAQWTTLNIYPNPRRIYYATATVESYRVMGEQAELVTKVLNRDGWEFDGIPVFKGTMHYGEINPELLAYAGRSFKEDMDNASLHADHSVPEGELEIYEDPFDKKRTQENINIIYDLPDRLRAMEESIIALYKLSRELHEQNKIIVASTQLQAEALANMGIVQGETAIVRAKTDDRTGYQ